MADTAAGRLLLADDDAAFREMTKLLLVREGYSCHTAADGPEVETLLNQREYDLLISDIDMPGNRDLSLIAGLPQMQAGLPVILVTGAPSVESAAKSVGLAVAAYLLKPLDTKAFLDTVRQTVERFRCYRAAMLSRERLVRSSEAMKALETELRSPVSGGSDPAVQAFVDLTIQNMHQSLLDLRSVLAVLRPAEAATPESAADQARQPLALVQALWETVAVLEKTKHAFKSKELGQLRKKLEGLVGSGPDAD
jgi:DNA-binding response OmpR family regulator